MLVLETFLASKAVMKNQVGSTGKVGSQQDY